MQNQKSGFKSLSDKDLQLSGMILTKLRLAVQVRIAKLIKSGIQQSMLFEFVVEVATAVTGSKAVVGLKEIADYR